jgi:hypothetical protein
MIPPLFGKQEVGIWRVKKRFPRYGVPIWSLCPNIRFLFLLPVCRLSWFLYTLNIYAHFSPHFSQKLLMAEIWYLVTSFIYVPHIVGSVFWPVRFLLPISNNKTDRHDITEILLKVPLKIKNPNPSIRFMPINIIVYILSIIKEMC